MEAILLRVDDVPTRSEAIRNKCLDCCCDNAAEVRRCTVVGCPLFPYRFGCSPETYQRRYPEAVKIIAKG